MWGEISKVPLPDFEPPRGKPERNPLRGFFKRYFTLERKPFRESPKRNPPRGISPTRAFHHRDNFHKDLYKAHYTRTPHKALPNRMVRNRSVSDLRGRPTLKPQQEEILIEPYFDGTPLKGAIRNLSCFARGGKIYGDFQTYPSRGLTD